MLWSDQRDHQITEGYAAAPKANPNPSEELGWVSTALGWVVQTNLSSTAGVLAFAIAVG